MSTKLAITKLNTNRVNPVFNKKQSFFFKLNLKTHQYVIYDKSRCLLNFRAKKTAIKAAFIILIRSN